ncbi:hypothetical protein Vadar_005453 [Vaccinium darrowii]|uniref:Uncharacterized protein n=1 Tax=Vaccinium darrowii TaxID=229202 RepID=A0ACB7Y5N9_9ERIC|nr:hypothetical protein Vadar_005453 [Vaccinium darrowii]
MSKTLVQPIGQKRLTNVAVVRLKKRGIRFEIACYKNKVLSWRSGVEKDLDEVLQSQTVYSNVSKGVLAKSKDLVAAFGTDDQSKICLEILDKGELQVAGKERESQLSIDPHNSSKKQALEVIHELQKQFPIKRSPMRLKLTDGSGNQLSVMCEMDPCFFRECDALVRNVKGRLEILAASIHVEGDTQMDHYDDREQDIAASRVVPNETRGSMAQTSEKQAARSGNADGEIKQNKCSTCNALVGDSKQYRDHFKSDWHKHNLRRKSHQLPPLTAEECLADIDVGDSKSDLKEYSF